MTIFSIKDLAMSTPECFEMINYDPGRNGNGDVPRELNVQDSFCLFLDS